MNDKIKKQKHERINEETNKKMFDQKMFDG